MEHPYYFRGEYVPGKQEKDFYSMLLYIAEKEIEVETEYLFANQFNTVPIPDVSLNGMRVMDTYVKKVIDDERPGKARCQWCGKTSSNVTVCGHCQKTGYLTIF